MAATPNKITQQIQHTLCITGNIIEKFVCDQNPITAAGQCLIGYSV